MKRIWLNFWFVLAIVILLSTGFFMYRFTTGIVKENREISSLAHEFELLENLRIQIRSGIINHRDFLLTGDSIFIKEYKNSKIQNTNTIQSLRSRANGEFIGLVTIDSVETLINLNYSYLDSLLSDENRNTSIEFENDIEYHSSHIFSQLSQLNFRIEQRLKDKFNYFRLSVTQRAYFSEYLIVIAYSVVIIILILSFTWLRKQIDNRLQAETKLLEMNRMKDMFFSIVAHDLRSPFNILINTSRLMFEAQKEQEIGVAEDLAKQVESISIRTFNLLNNLLEWANSQTGVLKMNMESLDLNALVKEIIAFYKPRIKEKSLTVETFDQPAFVVADRQMIHTVVRNLVGNATKFTPEGGEIKIQFKESGNLIMLSISDTGPGLRPHEFKKLFRIDIDSRQIGSGVEKGSGLGLILCKEFIEKHGGKIQARANTDGGCTFSFTLPK